MKKILLILCLGIFLISLVSAFSICIDHTPPSAPPNLTVSGEVGNILLTWDAATDEPSCSGIASYTINRNNPDNSITPLNVVDNNTLSFTDTANLEEGSYSYIVFATDLVGHNNGTSIINDVIIEEEAGEKRVSGGGGGSSYVCESNWECTDWSECIRGFRTRHCSDTNNCSYSYNKPIQRTDCETTFNLEGISLEEEPAEEGFFSRITGAAIGGVTDFAKSGAGALVFVILIVVAGGLVLFRVYKLRRKYKS